MKKVRYLIGMFSLDTRKSEIITVLATVAVEEKRSFSKRCVFQYHYLINLEYSTNEN